MVHDQFSLSLLWHVGFLFPGAYVSPPRSLPAFSRFVARVGRGTTARITSWCNKRENQIFPRIVISWSVIGGEANPDYVIESRFTTTHSLLGKNKNARAS